MAKSLFREVVAATLLGSSNSKTTDQQLDQAIALFGDEHSKATQFIRELDTYIRAIQAFDTASKRFFNFISSLGELGWPGRPIILQSCAELERIRSDHVELLRQQTSASAMSSMGAFDEMNKRINEQNRTQREYDKVRKQYQSSTKHDDQIKINRLRNELEQLKVTLNFTNRQLREDLPQFQAKRHAFYYRTFKELFKAHAHFYKNQYKQCNMIVDSIEPKQNQQQQQHQNTNVDATTKSRKLRPAPRAGPPPTAELYSKPTSRPKRTIYSQSPPPYKVLHQARVVHEHKAENEDEIDLRNNEVISIVSFLNEEDNQHDIGWEFALKSDGTIGVFPVNFAMRLYSNEN